MGGLSKSLNDIHAYWFEGIDDQTPIKKKCRPFQKWFRSNPQLDSEMRVMFGDLLEHAPGTALGEAIRDREQLCYILLYDQIARNIFRGTPRAYAYDGNARKWAVRMIAGQSDMGALLIERAFIYMPLMHSEELVDQELSVQKAEQLWTDAAERYPVNKDYYAGNLRYARNYYNIIKRFQRFPHRNSVLGRDSTPQEKEFLCS